MYSQNRSISKILIIVFSVKENIKCNNAWNFLMLLLILYVYTWWRNVNIEISDDFLILRIFKEVADVWFYLPPFTWRRRVGQRWYFRDAYLRSLSHTESIERICPVMPSILHNTFPYPAAPSLRFPPLRRRPRFTADIRSRIAFDVRHRFHIRCVEYSFPSDALRLTICNTTPLGGS